MSKVVVSLAGVSVSLSGRPVLESVDLEIDDCEFLGVVGPNGSGKTTLLRVILGLIEPDSGAVRILARVRSLQPIHCSFGSQAVAQKITHRFDDDERFVCVRLAG